MGHITDLLSAASAYAKAVEDGESTEAIERDADEALRAAVLAIMAGSADMAMPAEDESENIHDQAWHEGP
jgi:hypothetical protein